MSREPGESSLDIVDAVRFPLGERVRVWVLAVAGAGALAELVGATPIFLSGLIALVFRILLWVTVYRVASEILLTSAEGDTGAPGFRALEAADGLAVRHIGLWLVATFVLVVFSIYTGLPGLVLGILAIAAVLPAATIILTLSRSLTEALIPAQWFRLIARIGRGDYGRLFGALLAAGFIYVGIAAVLGWLEVARGLRNVVQLAYWAFAVFGWFHLAGRTVYLHRAELNLVEADTEPEQQPEQFTRDPDALWEEIRARGGTQEMHAELARQLQRSGDRERQLEHARLHIEALLFAFEKPGEALDRGSRMLEVDAGFALGSPDSMLALIGAAVDHHQPSLAGRLCAGYLEAFPESVKRNEVRLIGCEALQHENTSHRRHAQQWFRELMTAELGDDQRQRLNAIAPQYLESGSSRE